MSSDHAVHTAIHHMMAGARVILDSVSHLGQDIGYLYHVNLGAEIAVALPSPYRCIAS